MVVNAVSRNTTTILFDHDGTLINSESVHFTLWQEIMEKQGISLTEAFYCEKMAGIPVKQNAIDLVRHFSLTVSPEYLANEKYKKVKEYLSKQAFPLMPYAAETIKLCFDKGYRLAIVTGGSALSVQKTLLVYNLVDYISCVVSVEDVTYSKPAPDCYQLAMKKLAVLPSQCVAIEDTQHGMQAAVAAGVPCVVIPTAQSVKHNFSDATARYNRLQDWVEKELL